MNATASYVAVNVLAALLAVAGAIHDPAAGTHPAYLVLLSLLCSSALLELRSFNDRYTLLGAFSAYYFMQFGLLDIVRPFTGHPPVHAVEGLMSEAEAVILCGALAVQVCYRLALRLPAGRGATAVRDWSPGLVMVGGTVIWAVSTWLMWIYKVEIMTAASQAAARRGFAGLSSLQTLGFMVASYAQPLSIVMLAYGWCRYRRPWLVPVLAAAVAAQLLVGFVSDGKSEALMGVALIVLTRLLVEGRIPKAWLVVAAAFVAIVFPVLQANRMVRGEFGVDHVQAARDIGRTLERALSLVDDSQRGPDRAQTFFERMSLKGSVEMIVTRTGHGVAFRGGYTLLPLATVFVPRIIWPDKPDIEAGLLVTKDFHVSEVADLYTSPSHLGELYWNFGWPGILIGMPLIGLILGFTGLRTELAAGVNLTRVLILMATLQELVISSESTFAAPWSVWLRSVIGILLLHALLARRAVGAAPAVAAPAAARPAPGEASVPRWNFIP